MTNTSDMTNVEFVQHIMNFSKHGALSQMVVLDCLQRGLEHYISHKDEILEAEKARREKGQYSLVNMEAWVSCCEDNLQRIQQKYNPQNVSNGRNSI